MEENETAKIVLSRTVVLELLAQLKSEGMVLSRQPNSVATVGFNAPKSLLNLKETAQLLDHSYFWLSRNYKKLGLRPSCIGGKLLFHQGEIARLLDRHRIRARGRPRFALRRAG